MTHTLERPFFLLSVILALVGVYLIYVDSDAAMLFVFPCLGFSAASGLAQAMREQNRFNKVLTAITLLAAALGLALALKHYLR